MSPSLSMVRPVLAVAVVTLAVVMTVEGAPNYARSRARTNAVASRQRAAANPLPLVQSPNNNAFGDEDPRRYLPVDHTVDVKKARSEFFNKYEEQVKLIEDTRDGQEDGDGYYYDSEEDDDDDDDHEDGSEDDDEDEDDDDEEDSVDSDSESDYDSSSSSSSEEGDYDSSSEEDGLSSEESSEEDSSSSSSSEEDQGLGNHFFRAPKPVVDTPEVEQAKRKFFKLYKERAELAFNAPDY